jgi:hypothetical protein
MKRPDTPPDMTQRGPTTVKVTQEGDENDVTGVDNEENTLVVETPAGGGSGSGQVESPPATLDRVEPLQTVSDKVDAPIESHPVTSSTPNMPSGIENVQQLCARREMVPLLGRLIT